MQFTTSTTLWNASQDADSTSWPLALSSGSSATEIPLEIALGCYTMYTVLMLRMLWQVRSASLPASPSLPGLMQDSVWL